MKVSKNSWHYKLITGVIPQHKQDPPSTLGGYVGTTALLVFLGVALTILIGPLIYLLSILIGSVVANLIFGVDTRSLVATSSYEELFNYELFRNNAKMIISSGLITEVVIGFVSYRLFKIWTKLSTKLKARIEYE